MRDLALSLVVFSLLPFVLKKPFWGILMLAWLGYMNPHRLCYGFMYSLPVVYIVTIVTLLGMLISREAKRIVWSREIVLLIVFVAWMGVTTSQALYPGAAWEQYVKVIKIQILTFMTLILLTTRGRAVALVAVLAFSLGFYGLKGGLFTIAHGGAYRVQGPEGTFIGGNNELALSLTMTIPLLRFLHLQAQRQLWKAGLMALMVLTAIAAVGSQSRGALVGILCMGTLFWLKSRKKMFTLVLIVFATALIAILMPSSWYQRMATIDTYQEDGSAQGRINAWWMAWNMARDRFFGGGFSSFQAGAFDLYAPNPGDVHDSHSIYFGTLGHHGFVGLALFLGLLLMTWFKCGSTIRRSGRSPDLLWARDLVAMIQVSLVAYMSAGAFLGLMYFDYIYHLIALTVVVHELALRGSTAECAAQGAQAAAPAIAPGVTWTTRSTR